MNAGNKITLSKGYYAVAEQDAANPNVVIVKLYNAADKFIDEGNIDRVSVDVYINNLNKQIRSLAQY